MFSCTRDDLHVQLPFIRTGKTQHGRVRQPVSLSQQVIGVGNRLWSFSTAGSVDGF